MAQLKCQLDYIHLTVYDMNTWNVAIFSHDALFSWAIFVDFNFKSFLTRHSKNSIKF